MKMKNKKSKSGPSLDLGDFAAKDLSDRLITLGFLEFKNGSKLTLTCAKTKEKIRGLTINLPIVDF